jgi:hypothetical protein
MGRAMGHFRRYAEKLQTEGGYTVDPRTGKEPTQGYMVGQFGTGQVRPPGTTRGHDLARYAVEHAKQLSGPPHYLGGWQQPEGDYTEQSDLYPATPAGKTQSGFAAILGNQQASFAIHTKQDIANPSYEEDELPAHKRRMARMSGVNVTSPLPQPRTGA